MNTLVLGGTGWLGHKIALAFFRAGHKVTVASRGKRSEFADRLAGIERLTLDKEDEEAVKALFSSRNFEWIIDSVPSVRSIELIQRYARGLFHYVHCSSTGGYAPLPFIPCDETAPYGAFQGGTGWSQKAKVDKLAMELFAAAGFPATVLRPCYITGGGDLMPLDNFGGRRDDFLADILAEKTLELPDDGQALLQPIHVDDLAEAFLLAAQNSGSISQRYNICLDHAVTLKCYMELNAMALGKKAKITYLPLEEMVKRHPEVNETWLRFFATHMCFTNAKARRDLGFAPKHTPEEAIMETARMAAPKSVK